MQTAEQSVPNAGSTPEEKTVSAKRKPSRALSKMKRKAVMVRWESVEKQREEWLAPFYKLPIDRAMKYLEDLRDVCELAGGIMNERISKDDPRNIRCAGPRCGKDLSIPLPTGKPRWIAKKDFKDKRHPEIWHSLYFCSELCNNAWIRSQNDAVAPDARGKENT
jgi:hypothetical protein